MKLASALFAAAITTCLFGAIPAQASSFPAFGHGLAEAAVGSVHGVGNTAVSFGPIAPVALECQVAPGFQSNSTASIALPSGLMSGSAYDTVASMRGSGSAAMQSISTVQNVNLLGGLVTASALTAVANSFANGVNASSNGTGSSFTNLVIAGASVSADTAPNTSIALPGIGSVVLNEQNISGTSSTTAISVIMLHVYVTQLNPLISIGSDISIARADAGVGLLVRPSTVSAESYGLLINGLAGNLTLSSGPTAPAETACTPGTSTVQTAGLTTPVGLLGATVDTAVTSLTTTGSSANATADITKVNLLGGMLQANAIVSNATIVIGSTVARSGSVSLANAILAGKPLAANPLPNTKIALPGLGYAILNEQTSITNATAVNETVTAIDIYITASNLLNLPVGGRIQVARSRSTILAF